MVEHRYAFEPFVEDGLSFNRYTAWLRKMGTHAGNDAIIAFAKIHDLTGHSPARSTNLDNLRSQGLQNCSGIAHCISQWRGERGSKVC